MPNEFSKCLWSNYGKRKRLGAWASMFVYIDFVLVGKIDIPLRSSAPKFFVFFFHQRTLMKEHSRRSSASCHGLSAFQCFITSTSLHPSEVPVLWMAGKPETTLPRHCFTSGSTSDGPRRGIPREKARLKGVQATCSGALTAKQADGNPLRPTGVTATS